jgi:hypothetical protein
LETLVPKLVLSLFLAICCFFLLKYKEYFLKKTNGNESSTVLWAMLLLRITPFVLVYLLLGYGAKSDVLMFYDWAQMAKSGAIVYKEFPSPYGPLFSYITALPLFIWNAPEALILLMILVECLAVWLTYKYILPTAQSHYYVVLYLLLPSTIVLSVLGGQEDVWIWLLFVLSILAYTSKKSDLALGIGMGVALVVTKVLFVLLLPFSFFWVKNKIKFVLGLLLVGIPTLAILYYVGEWSFLLPIQQANDPRTPNIWSVLNPFFQVYHNIGIKVLNFSGLASLVWAGVYIVIKQKKVENNTIPSLIHAFVVTFMVMMLLQQSSLANYVYMFLLPWVLYLMPTYSRHKTHLVLLLSVATVVQPALWWGLKMPIYSGPKELLEPYKLIEYCLEILIVGCLLYFCRDILCYNSGPKSQEQQKVTST